jgi:hypothetical protein
MQLEVIVARTPGVSPALLHSAPVSARVLVLVIVIGLAGCADAPALVARGSDPKTTHEDRVDLLHDALTQREPGVVPDLVGRAEALLEAGGKDEKACALDVLDALVWASDKTAQALAVRLADHESPLLRSKEALQGLAKHRDPTVRGLARERLRALK